MLELIVGGISGSRSGMEVRAHSVLLMGRLDDANWWWEYALDGVVGAVLGGLVTALAVWLTLRHERRLVNEESVRSELAADIAQGKTAGLAAIGAAFRLADRLLDRTEETGGTWAAFLEAAFIFESAVSQRWPETAAELEERFARVDELLQEDPRPLEEIQEEIWMFTRLARRWMGNPARIEELATIQRSQKIVP